MSVWKNIRSGLKVIGVDPDAPVRKLMGWSIHMSNIQDQKVDIIKRITEIIPDISHQEFHAVKRFKEFWEFKRRSFQASQCQLMMRMLESFPTNKRLTVVDIGDSAGTHMMYLKKLAAPQWSIDTISVNLDKRAVKKIESQGMKAVLCRAEDLDLGDAKVDFFTCFQTLEHFHNPAIFLRRLAKKPGNEKFVITLPYVKVSRVGLHGIRDELREVRYAEDEHIFELCPQDWELLMLHSGWKIISSRIYYQYPRHLGPLSWLLALLWRKVDYEGFWGVILEKDLTYSDLYQDWEEEKIPVEDMKE